MFTNTFAEEAQMKTSLVNVARDVNDGSDVIGVHSSPIQQLATKSAQVFTANQSTSDPASSKVNHAYQRVGRLSM